MDIKNFIKTVLNNKKEIIKEQKEWGIHKKYSPIMVKIVKHLVKLSQKSEIYTGSRNTVKIGCFTFIEDETHDDYWKNYTIFKKLGKCRYNNETGISWCKYDKDRRCCPTEFEEKDYIEVINIHKKILKGLVFDFKMKIEDK